MPKFGIFSRFVIKPLNTVSLLLSVAFKMSSVVMPTMAAAVTAAPLVEYELSDGGNSIPLEESLHPKPKFYELFTYTLDSTFLGKRA